MDRIVYKEGHIYRIVGNHGYYRIYRDHKMWYKGKDTEQLEMLIDEIL